MNRVFYEPKNDENLPPVRKYAGDAGLDLTIQEDVVIEPGSTAYLPTYVRFELEPNMCVEILTRSSTFKKGVVVTPTIVDSQYTGYVSTIVTNNHVYPVKIEKGTRLAQAILHRYYLFDNETESKEIRNDKKFGSSGK